MMSMTTQTKTHSKTTPPRSSLDGRLRQINLLKYSKEKQPQKQQERQLSQRPQRTKPRQLLPKSPTITITARYMTGRDSDKLIHNQVYTPTSSHGTRLTTPGIVTNTISLTRKHGRHKLKRKCQDGSLLQTLPQQLHQQLLFRNKVNKLFTR